MKRQFSLLSLFQPIYILFAGAIGFIITKVMFVQWASPFLVKEPGDRFFRVPYPNFLALVLVVAVFLAFLAIIFLPVWKLLFDLIKETMTNRAPSEKLRITLALVLGALGFMLVLFVYMQISRSIRITPEGITPLGMSARLNTLLYGAVLTIFPVALISLLIFWNVYEVGKNIPASADNEQQLLTFAHELLRYRSLLQNSLLVIGVVASVLPVVTAIVRSIMIEFDKTGDVAELWPAIYPIMYGLAFTTILILFYAPTHLMLTQVGEKLRDTLCPIRDLSEMDRNLKRRKDIDEWLQLNLSLTQNLKAGIATLAPLITGFITSIPGLKILG